MNTMRTQHRQMMSRLRIYAAVRSGARATRYGGATKSNGRGGSDGGVRARPARLAATTFRPVAESIMPRVLAGDLARTPEERQRLERLFGELLASYRERVRASGGPQLDVARAAAYLVAASHDAYYDAEPLSVEEYDAVREHMRGVYAADEKFARAGDRERQEMFETFGILATWVDAGSKTARRDGDRDGVRHWREVARGHIT